MKIQSFVFILNCTSLVHVMMYMLYLSTSIGQVNFVHQSNCSWLRVSKAQNYINAVKQRQYLLESPGNIQTILITHYNWISYRYTSQTQLLIFLYPSTRISRTLTGEWIYTKEEYWRTRRKNVEVKRNQIAFCTWLKMSIPMPLFNMAK